MDNHPELQELYAERQRYPLFANTIDKILSYKYNSEEQLVYYLLWHIANLSIDSGISNRTVGMCTGFDKYLLRNITESISKTYYAEMRNLGLIKGLEDFKNAKPE